MLIFGELWLIEKLVVPEPAPERGKVEIHARKAAQRRA
jgi:hypothetical protein